MSVKNIVLGTAGADNIVPRISYIETNNTITEVLATGYLNAAVQEGYSFTESDMCLVSTKLTPSATVIAVGWYEITKVGSDTSLTSTGSPGSTLLPTVTDRIVHAADANGTLTTDAANVTNLGNIIAGASGTAGTLRSFSSTAARGSLLLTAVANTGDTLFTISNAAHGQATVISVPDGAQATTEFIIADSAGIQHITSGALQIDAGALSIGLAAGGFAGSAILYSATAAMGSLRLLTVDSAGDFAVTVSNASHAQSTVVSITDGGQATTEFIIADSATTQNITSGALQVDAGAISTGLAAGGFAGSFVAYSTTASLGSLRLLAVDSAGDFAVTVSNASHAQASVVSIPDGGQATTEFIIADSASTQHITSGAFQVDAGAISSGLLAGGTAGSLVLWSATTASGSLILLPVINATGDFDTTISNAVAVAQDQVITVPDSGAATGNFILSGTAAGTQSLSTSLSFVGGGTNIQITGGGNFIAGSDTAAGHFTSFSATTVSGTLSLTAIDNATGDFDTEINNAAAVGQDQVVTIPDLGAATGSFLTSTLVLSQPGANVITKNITVGQAAVATAGEVTIQASSGADQYKILEIFLNSGGTNFSGGGGDRLGQVTDGTTVYSVVPAAQMQALVNARWGDTATPFPASAPINTSTVAAADLVFSYSGGATDYTAGSLVITVVLEKVAQQIYTRTEYKVIFEWLSGHLL